MKNQQQTPMQNYFDLTLIDNPLVNTLTDYVGMYLKYEGYKWAPNNGLAKRVKRFEYSGGKFKAHTLVFDPAHLNCFTITSDYELSTDEISEIRTFIKAIITEQVENFESSLKIALTYIYNPAIWYYY